MTMALSRSQDNPRNRFSVMDLEWDPGVENPQSLRVWKEEAKSLLSRNDSPDLPFRWSANPYRGCSHACAYCYARPTHEFLGYGAGTDFETQIVAKTNAPELLRQAFRKPTWQGEPVAFSGVTDCYQHAESSLKLMRQCLQVCVEEGNPAGVITKSALILRDKDLLTELNQGPGVNAVMSIPMLNPEVAKALEPHAPSPDVRLRTLEKLAATGIRTGISLGPVIPGLTDADIPALLKAAKDAGASFAFFILLRLPGAVAPVFQRALESRLPDYARKVMHHIRDTRGGELYRSEFGSRMRGEGPMAEMVTHLFHLHARRLGLEVGEKMEGLVPWGGRGRPDRKILRASREKPTAGEPLQQSLF
jgi:DNA repair photolyase